jgi:hypothetical protein
MPAVTPAPLAVPVPPAIVESRKKPALDNPLEFLLSDPQPIRRKAEPVGAGWLRHRSVLTIGLTAAILTVAAVLVGIALNFDRNDAAPPSPSTVDAVDVSDRPAVGSPPKPIKRSEHSQTENRPATIGIANEAPKLEPTVSKPIQVDADRLSAEFQSNPNAATRKWLTKSAQIRGTVKSVLPKGNNELLDIGRGSGDGPVLIFESGDKPYLVRCHLESADGKETEMTAIEAGAIAIVDGVCTGVGRNALDYEAITGQSPPSSPVEFGFIDIEQCKLVSVRNSGAPRKQNRAVADIKDDPATIVRDAKAAWQKALDEANADLAASIEEAHKDAVAARDTAALQSIATDKSALEQQNVYPHSKVMRPYLEAYLKKRSNAAETLIRAYDEAVGVCKNDVNFSNDEMATTIGDEKQAFVALEAKTKDAIQAGKPLPEAPSGSAEYLKRLSKRLSLELDAVATLDTSAKRDDAHSAMMHKLDAEMQKLSLTFRFPIKDVEHSHHEGQYTFNLNEPDETATLGRCGHLENVVLPFSPNEIAKTHPGDVLVFTGSPRLRAQAGGFGPAVDGTVSMIYLESPVTHQCYEIALQKYRVKIERK